MADKPRYYLTTAIAYPNGPPHIGHAYEAIATDAIARFMRLDGYDVLFVTGTDEHGIKMLQTAAREKLTPPQLVELFRVITAGDYADMKNDGNGNYRFYSVGIAPTGAWKYFTFGD